MYFRQRGSVSVEWSIGTAACMAALFFPVFGGDSAVGLLVEAIQQWHQHSSLLLSLP